MVQRNYNTLLGRYPGADGMKTGFICASGFNLVATATRDGRRLIAVVLGAPSSSVRAIQAAELLEKGFAANPLSRLMASFGKVENLQPVDAAPADLHEEMCGKHRRRPAAEDEDDSEAVAKLGPDSPFAGFLSSLRGGSGKQNLLQDADLGEPVVVFTGTSPKQPSVSKTAAVHSKPSSKAADGTAEKPATKPGAKPHPAGEPDPWGGMRPASSSTSPAPQLAGSPNNAADSQPVKRRPPKTAGTAEGSKAAAKQPQKSAKTTANKTKGASSAGAAHEAPHKTSDDSNAK
jgi:D-alanyl-D-alanine carboxypeptidase